MNPRDQRAHGTSELIGTLERQSCSLQLQLLYFCELCSWRSWSCCCCSTLTNLKSAKNGRNTYKVYAELDIWSTHTVPSACCLGFAHWAAEVPNFEQRGFSAYIGYGKASYVRLCLAWRRQRACQDDSKTRPNADQLLYGWDRNEGARHGAILLLYVTISAQ